MRWISPFVIFLFSTIALSDFSHTFQISATDLFIYIKRKFLQIILYTFRYLFTSHNLNYKSSNPKRNKNYQLNTNEWEKRAREGARERKNKKKNNTHLSYYHWRVKIKTIRKEYWNHYCISTTVHRFLSSFFLQLHAFLRTRTEAQKLCPAGNKKYRCERERKKEGKRDRGDEK